MPEADRVGVSRVGKCEAPRRGQPPETGGREPSLVVIEFDMNEKLGDGSGHLLRRVPVVVVLRGEAEAAVTQHITGEVMSCGGSLNPQVAEHGV